MEQLDEALSFLCSFLLVLLTQDVNSCHHYQVRQVSLVLVLEYGVYSRYISGICQTTLIIVRISLSLFFSFRSPFRLLSKFNDENEISLKLGEL